MYVDVDVDLSDFDDDDIVDYVVYDRDLVRRIVAESADIRPGSKSDMVNMLDNFKKSSPYEFEHLVAELRERGILDD